LRYQNAREFQEDIRKSLVLLDPNEQQLSLPLGIPEELRRPLRTDKPKKQRNQSAKVASVPREMTNPQINNSGQIRRRSSRRVRRNRLVALAIAGAIGIAGWYQLFGPGSQIAIPSVVGGTKQEAERTLENLGFKVKVSKSVFHEQIPKGKIISMAPPAGSRLAEGESISILLSKGAERYKVPSLKGKNVSQATIELANIKLVIGSTQSQFDTKIPKDQIISTSPTSGTMVKKNTEVNLLISKGPELVAVANYVGKNSEQALNELTEAGFDVKQREEFSDKYPIGIVIAQIPTDPELTKGAEVALTISKGPEKIKVPSGVLKSEELKAIKLLEDYGFAVKVLKPAKVAKGKKLTVVKVSPSEGTLVKPNSVITIEVK
jgi:serine/threonine-protein kinase